MTFRPATLEDEEFFWYWREAAERRHWYEGRVTTRAEHGRWFRARIGRLTMLVWEMLGVSEGVVRIDSNGEVAFHANPSLMAEMLEELKPYAAEYGGRLKVTVDKQDRASERALQEAGFTEFPVTFFAYKT